VWRYYIGNSCNEDNGAQNQSDDCNNGFSGFFRKDYFMHKTPHIMMKLRDLVYYAEICNANERPYAGSGSGPVSANGNRNKVKTEREKEERSVLG
jgi:hypothetical protein